MQIKLHYPIYAFKFIFYFSISQWIMFIQGIKSLIYGIKTIDFIFSENFMTFFTKMTVQGIAVMEMTH